MKQRQMAVCSNKPDYALRFAEFARTKTTLFNVAGFSDIEHLYSFASEHTIDILLLSDDLAVNYSFEDMAGRVSETYILTEDAYKSQGNMPFVYMLQSCTDILRQIEDFYADSGRSPGGNSVRMHHIKKIAVYSPVNRTGKTSFALAFGREAAKRVRTLYVNMEEYSGFSTLYPCGGHTLSELLYFLKQGKSDFACKLEATIRQLGPLDYIPPLRSPMEYGCIRKDDWEALIGIIEKETLYDILIIDLGCLPAGLFDILDECDFIYTPISTDEISRAKLEQYKRSLTMLNLEHILEHSSLFEMPSGAGLDLLAKEESERWCQL